AIENEAWRVRPLVEVAPRGCVKTGKPDGRCDGARDTPGPATIAASFERAVGDRQQRAVVVGNGSFLSNAFVANGGNRGLGANMINWLSGDENLITIQPKSAHDTRIRIDSPTLFTMSF